MRRQVVADVGNAKYLQSGQAKKKGSNELNITQRKAYRKYKKEQIKVLYHSIRYILNIYYQMGVQILFLFEIVQQLVQKMCGIVET
jgi:hypothetical protein